MYKRQVALLVASWFYMPGGLFLLVILGYGTMLMLHIPVTERVFKPYLADPVDSPDSMQR